MITLKCLSMKGFSDSKIIEKKNKNILPVLKSE